MYQIVFYVPESHAEEVKNAMFAHGAGSFGNYDRCSWQVRGDGQFRPLNGARPFVGTPDTVQSVKEIRVEMMCTPQQVTAAVEALLAAHPYEVPAYSVTQAYTLEDLG